MVQHPVPGDLLAPADPHVLVGHDVVQEALQTHGTAGMAAQTHVQAHGHHLRVADPLAVQHVKAIPGVCEKILSSREHTSTEFRVVHTKRVRHHQMRPVVGDDPVGQLIVIGIRVVEKATLLHQQTPCVDARTIAAIPAERAGPDAVLQRGDGLVDVLALLCGVEFLVFLPAPAMAADVIAGLRNSLGRRRITLECQRTAKNRQG